MTEPSVAAPVIATAAARAAIATLTSRRGPIMFFQSGGCCDGSLPMCFADGELLVGDNDVLLGIIDGCPFYIAAAQYQAWKHTQLILDVEPGAPEGFSLPAGLDDAHFVTRSRVLSLPSPYSLAL